MQNLMQVQIQAKDTRGQGAVHYAFLLQEAASAHMSQCLGSGMLCLQQCQL